jgi:AcrR family transcriptional regulator
MGTLRVTGASMPASAATQSRRTRGNPADDISPLPKSVPHVVRGAGASKAGAGRRVLPAGHISDRVVSFLTMRSGNSATERTFIEQARRRQLVASAIEQLAEAGYSGTTLAAVASRAGVSKAAVLYHFTGGKDELLTELMDTVLADATRVMAERIAAEPTLPGKLRAYITANVGYLAAHRLEILAVTAIFNGAPPLADGASVWEPRSERAVAELTGLLQAGQQAGVFGAFSATVVARSLRGAIDALEPVLRHQPEADLDEYAAELVAVFEKVVAP